MPGAESIHTDAGSYGVARRKPGNLAGVKVSKTTLQCRGVRVGQEIEEFGREYAEGVPGKQEDGTANPRKQPRKGMYTSLPCPERTPNEQNAGNRWTQIIFLSTDADEPDPAQSQRYRTCIVAWFTILNCIKIADMLHAENMGVRNGKHDHIASGRIEGLD